MNRLQKLQRLTDYLSAFSMTVRLEDGEHHISPLMTTAQSDATSKLAFLSGAQVLVARPEVYQSGDSDTHRDSVSTAVFVLEKNLGLEKTPLLEQLQYSRLLTIADAILGKIAADTSGDDCTLTTGLALTSVNAVPEVSLFGGWGGYSMELTFE